MARNTDPKGFTESAAVAAAFRALDRDKNLRAQVLGPLDAFLAERRKNLGR